MRAKLIFGREPAAWIGLIEAVLALLMALSFGVNQDTFGPIMAAVVAAFGIYIAWVTKDTMLGAIVGFVKAAFILATVYGFSLGDEQTAAIIGVITVVAGFWNRNQTYPTEAPPEVPVGATPVVELKG